MRPASGVSSTYAAIQLAGRSRDLLGGLFAKLYSNPEASEEDIETELLRAAGRAIHRNAFKLELDPASGGWLFSFETQSKTALPWTIPSV